MEARPVQTDVNQPAVPVERLRAMIRLLSPGELTPIAKRQLELLCQEYDGASK